MPNRAAKVVSSPPMEPSGQAGVRRWGLWAVAGLLVLAEMVRAPSVHLDFAPLYGAAVLAGEGRLAEAYEVHPEVRKRAGATLTKAVQERRYPLRHCLRFLHPPALAGLAMPLALADFPVAATLFRTLSLAALVAAAFALSRVIRGRHGGGGTGRTDPARTGAALAVVLLLAFDPVRMTLDLGQTNLFVMALLCAGLVTSHAPLAGVAVGVACLFKTHAWMVPFAWLVAGGEWRRRGLWAVLTLAVAHAWAYIAWPEATFAYLDMMRDLSGQQFLWPEQQSFPALLSRVEGGFRAEDVSDWVETVAPAGVAAHLAPAFSLVVAVGVAAWIRAQRLNGEAAMALAVPAGLLASPVLHSHYGTLLAIPAAWLLRNASGSLPAWLGLAGIGLQALPLHSDEARAWVPLFEGIGVHWVFVTYRLVGVALVLAAVVAATRRRREMA